MDQLFEENLRGKIHLLKNKRITLGFDGFVDEVVKVIQSVDESEGTMYFKTIREFGNYIVGKSDKNFAMELEEKTTKIGGNMPIMANALAQFGSSQFCVGTLGYPRVHEVFLQMPSNCTALSFANPGYTTAMEFNGAKILMAKMGDLNQVDWNTLIEMIGIEELSKVFMETDLVCLLNWSEIKNSNLIWKGLIKDILQKKPIRKKLFAFVDLADCSRKSDASILEAIDLLKEFSVYWNVVLGLNLNEASKLYEVLTQQKSEGNDIETLGEKLFDLLSIHSLVIHYSKRAMVWDQSGFHQRNSFFVANPKLSTGAGDNFNAGYCAGLLMDFPSYTCLFLGHATSSYYVQHGKSPNAMELVNSIKYEK